MDIEDFFTQGRGLVAFATIGIPALAGAAAGYFGALRQIRAGKHPDYKYVEPDIDEAHDDIAFVNKYVGEVKQRITAITDSPNLPEAAQALDVLEKDVAALNRIADQAKETLERALLKAQEARGTEAKARKNELVNDIVAAIGKAGVLQGAIGGLEEMRKQAVEAVQEAMTD